MRSVMFLRGTALAALLVCSSAAMAQECPLPAGADAKLAHVDAPTRLQFLRLSLNSDAKKVQRWRWGWVGGFSFLTAFNLGSASASGPALTTQPADFVGAGASALSILPLLVNPPHVARDAPAFDAKVKTAAPGDVCGLVAEGEKLLAEDAHNEAFAAGWVTQVLNVVLNGAVFAIIGAGYHSWSSAAITGGIGVVLGEVMIQTTPTNLVKDQKAYQSGILSTGSSPESAGGAASRGFTIMPAGLGVAGTF